MILNLASLSFNLNVESGGGTPAWGTELGQGEGYRFSFEDMSEFFTALVYSSVSDIENVICPLGKGGNQQNDYDFVIASLFNKVYVNEVLIPGERFLLLIVKKISGEHHVGRRTLKYNPRMTYRGIEINSSCYNKIPQVLGWNQNSGWFINEIRLINQDEIHFFAYSLNEERPVVYHNSEERKQSMISKLRQSNAKFRISSLQNNISRQMIYYGAPGTGKSHKIKELLKGISKENIFRTTFHPDSDYSSFVGAYKPTKAKKPLYGLNGGLTVRLNDGKEDIDEEIITYKFIPQAFLNAYMQAYRKPAENVYLIVEEINRGNCAQIFGDLFQLLDRDENGVSEYSIKADADLRTFLEEELGEDSDAIKNGELCLPGNLYIYATMNTSDQSLFPIDSAFKRRWDWEYEPIKYMNTSWAIDIDDIKYSWVSFQKEVNTRIFDLTHSEDKMLGDFFVNPADGIIKADLFRNKVLFYLWNDVCKDGEGDIFRISDEEEIKFSELYGDDGDKKLVAMMEYLHIADLPSIKNIDVNKDGNLSGNNSKDKTRFTLNGDDNNGRGYSKGGVAYEAVKLFCSQHPQMTADEVMTKWLSLQIIGANLVETQEVYNKRTSGSTDSRLSEKSKIVTLQNGEQLYVTNQFDLSRINDFIQKVNAQNWGIDIQKFN